MEQKPGIARLGYIAVAAIAAWFALALQFYITVAGAPARGASLLSGAILYFSFFTVLTNILVAFSLTATLLPSRSRLGEFFSRPTAKGAVATYIIVVGLVYSLLLRNLWNPQSLQLIADVILHDVTPVVFVAYWLLFVPKGLLKWEDAASWLIFPAVYFLYVLFRGELSDLYPYPFTDAAELGYPRVLFNAAMFTFAMWCLGLVLVAVDRRMGTLRDRRAGLSTQGE